MIHVHLGVDIVHLYNKHVEINSLDKHPTESGHQEILHKNCCCDTGSLQEREKKHRSTFSGCGKKPISSVNVGTCNLPYFLWRLSRRERSFVQLRGTQKDINVFVTEVDEHPWQMNKNKEKKPKRRTRQISDTNQSKLEVKGKKQIYNKHKIYEQMNYIFNIPNVRNWLQRSWKERYFKCPL